MKGTKYKIIQTEKELDQLILYCKQTRYASIDFETTGLEFYEPNHYPTILGVSFQIGSCWIIPLGHFDSPFKGNFSRILQKFSKGVLEDDSIVKMGWNFKFENKWLKRYDCRVLGIILDGMLAKYLLDETRPSGLKEMTDRFMPERGGYEEEVQILVKKQGWAGVPLDRLAYYCAQDCDNTFRLTMFFEKLCMKYNFYNLLRNMLMMQSRVLAEIEYQGMILDIPWLKQMDKKYAKLIQEEEKKLRSNRKLLLYEKSKLEEAKLNLIGGIKGEIKDIKKQIEEEIDQKVVSRKQKAIQTREEKIKNITLGILSNKKERKIEEPFNFNSPKQLGDFLFLANYGLKLRIIRYTKDKDTKQETDTPSTAEDVLLVLEKKDKSGFMKSLMEYRGLSTLYNTFIKGSLEKMGSDERLHTSYLIHGTVTSRLSSAEPNLQNLPRVTTNPDIKKMFLPNPNCYLVEFDYSQAELRVVAELANETEMIRWFNEGRNIHVAVAAKVNKVDYEVVYPITKDENHPDHIFWTKQKKRSKTINFGILYEQGDEKLAEGMGCSKEEASQFKKEWFASFPRIKKWINGQHEFVNENGYVSSIFGRKRRLEDIWSNQRFLQMEAQRQSVNSPIQSAASDFTQLAIIMVYMERIKGNFPSYMVPFYTVHDSIGFSIPPEKVNNFAPRIIEICKNPQTLKYFGFEMKKVKMKASCELGINWGSYSDYDSRVDYVKQYK